MGLGEGVPPPARGAGTLIHSAPRLVWACRLLCPRDSPGKNNGVGCCALHQGIFSRFPLCLAHPPCFSMQPHPRLPPRCGSGGGCFCRHRPLLWSPPALPVCSPASVLTHGRHKNVVTKTSKIVYWAWIISLLTLGWPWEAQSSPRVARETWGLR